MGFLRQFLLIFIFFIHFFPLKATVLDEVKDRGYLICGVSEPRIGFASIDDNSNWVGFDVDMCRAVATAIFADPSKVEFIITTNRSRFPILAGGEIDMLSRITTWTFSRDVNLGFEFAGTKQDEFGPYHEYRYSELSEKKITFYEAAAQNASRESQPW